MRRFLTAVIAISFLAQPAVTLAIAGGPTLVAQPSQSSVATNGTFTVTVQMDTKTYQVTAAELHLTFPADKLQATSVQPGTFLSSVLTPGATGSGTASITVGSGTQPKQGTGSVMVVTFKALAPGSATVAFANSTQVAAVGQPANTVDTMTPTTITITSGGATSTPAPTAAPTSTIAPTAAPGGGGGGGGFGFTPTPSRTPSRTPTPTGAVNAGAVSTGPMESGMLALIVSAIAVLAYVGYASTDEFRRREAQGIATQEGGRQPDFKE